jgi:hypothetical protein
MRTMRHASRLLLVLGLGLVGCGDDAEDTGPRADAGADASATESAADARASSDPDAARERCEMQRQASGEALQLSLASADKHCSVDDDCTNVGLRTACYLSCSAVLSKAGKEQLLSAAATHASTICQGFGEAGCINTALPCALPPPASCVAGSCR